MEARGSRQQGRQGAGNREKTAGSKLGARGAEGGRQEAGDRVAG